MVDRPTHLGDGRLAAVRQAADGVEEDRTAAAPAPGGPGVGHQYVGAQLSGGPQARGKRRPPGAPNRIGHHLDDDQQRSRQQPAAAAADQKPLPVGCG